MESLCSHQSIFCPFSCISWRGQWQPKRRQKLQCSQLCHHCPYPTVIITMLTTLPPLSIHNSDHYNAHNFATTVYTQQWSLQCSQLCHHCPYTTVIITMWSDSVWAFPWKLYCQQQLKRVTEQWQPMGRQEALLKFTYAILRLCSRSWTVWSQLFCAISRLAAQSWDWHAVSGFWECTTQSWDFTNS